MDRRAREQIRTFLSKVGHPTLRDFYGLSQDASVEEIHERMLEKRLWAQANEANPRHQELASWLIRHHAMLQRALKEGDVSLPKEQGGDEHPPGEAGSAHIDPDDYYQVLGASPEASPEELEASYRARYRWARSLKDMERALQTYRELERAWHHLSDPGRRAAYDARRAAPPTLDEAHPSRRYPATTSMPPVSATASMPPVSATASMPPISRTSTPVARIELSHIKDAGSGEAPSSDQPRLLVDGPALIRIRPDHPPRVAILRIRSATGEPMAARITSSQPWLTPTPALVECKADTKRVELRYQSSRVPRSGGLARVNVSTPEGERWTVNVEVAPKRSMGLSLMVALLLAAAGALWLWHGSASEGTGGQPGTTIED